MAAALKLAKKTTTEGLIEEAGSLQAQIANLTNRYKTVRRELEARIEIPEGKDLFEVTSGGFTAKLYYKEKTRIIPEKLQALNADLFWRTCQVPVKTVQDILSRDEFYVVSEMTREALPELSIRKARDEG